MQMLASFIGVLLLSSVHIFYDSFQRTLSRRLAHWTSVAGGVAVGYVFLYLFPKLSDYTSTIIIGEQGTWEPLRYRLYFFALLGFLVYQAMEFYGDQNRHKVTIWNWAHAAGFCAYNALIGYIATGIPRPGILPVFLAVLPIGFHLLGMNHMMSGRMGKLFRSRVRWLFAASLFFGWITGSFASLPVWVTTGFTAFVAGAIIINVISEELPDRGKGSLWAFMAGVAFFSVFMSIIRTLPRIG